MDWIALSERKPTAEDGDSAGEVLWRFFNKVLHRNESFAAKWNDVTWLGFSTHFARIKDIKLPPPPKPVMPERIELVKCEDTEEADVLVRESDGQFFNKALAFHPTGTYRMYRRVAPTKRIVFEVGEKWPPKKGEWHIPLQTDLGPACAINDFDRPRTILRLVEGEEYLK